MGRRKYSTGVFRVNVEEDGARLQRIFAKRKYSDIHSITLEVYKFLPLELGPVDANVYLTILRLKEENGKHQHTDVYSFNFLGRLLCHNYSLSREHADHTTEVLVRDKRDMSLERLRSHRLAIEEMLNSTFLPTALVEDAIIGNLIRGIFEEHKSVS